MGLVYLILLVILAYAPAVRCRVGSPSGLFLGWLADALVITIAMTLLLTLT